MIPKENNYAYIDGANLHKGIKSLGWNLDYARLRIWLLEKYSMNTTLIMLYQYLVMEIMPAWSNFFMKNIKLKAVLSPGNRCSILIKRTNVPP